jgi:predicted nucleotide-binding protein
MVAVELARSPTHVRKQIEDARKEGTTLLGSAPEDETGLADFRERYLCWESKTSAILEASFKVSGFMTTSPKDEFNGTAISLLDLKITATTIPLERLPEVLTDIREKIRVLKSIDERLDVYEAPTIAPAVHPATVNAPIFLVHGRDLQRREIVRRFLEAVTDRNIVVLAEQPNRGQDLLGKLLSNAQQAGFAVVLLTADDLGGLEGDHSKPRARQNVVFELGLFVGLLGRDKVAALNDPRIEIPTDFSGVAYIPIGGESWQIELARELKAAGISVSLDRAI